MVDTSQIREHMEVVGSDGRHLGAVDHVDGQRIKLTRSDPAAKGEHHYVGLELVDRVENGAVRLNQTAATVTGAWGSEARGAAPGSSRASP